MDDLPPPPPPRPDLPGWQVAGPAPAEGRAARPGPVTAAGVILIVTGAIGAIAGLALMLMRPQDLANLGSVGNLDLSRSGRSLGQVALVLGALQVLAGVLVLRLTSAGRILGLVLTGLGVLGGLGSVSRGAGQAVIGLGLDAFVFYVLVTHGAAFRRTRGA